MKIAIVGSREFKDRALVQILVPNYLRGRFTVNAEHTLVSGGAKGVDSWAENVAKLYHANCIIFKPDWDKYGKKAGFLRNQQIVDEADQLIAFWDGQSKGTKHSIDLAIKKCIPVDIYIRK